VTTRGEWTEIDSKILEGAAEKLILYGQQVGVMPEDLISLLDSGISIRELLIFLLSKSSGAT
jgi:hypothetical protein